MYRRRVSGQSIHAPLQRIFVCRHDVAVVACCMMRWGHSLAKTAGLCQGPRLLLCRQQDERYISMGCAASLAKEGAAWLRGEAWRAMTCLPKCEYHGDDLPDG